MKQLPKYYKTEILSLVKEGKTSNEIAKILDLKKSAIQSMFYKNNIKTFKALSNTPYKNKEEILNLANEGKTPVQIAKLLNLNKVSVNSFLNREGYKYTYDQGNINYFENINTKEKAYILGFIAADGYIINNKGTNTYTFGVQINNTDISFLIFLKNQLMCENPITTPNDKMVRLTISNKKLVSDLFNLGITMRKSKTLTNIIENVPYDLRNYFILGYFDGDGCYTINKANNKFVKSTNEISNYDTRSINISIRGTEALLKGIKDHLNFKFSRVYYNVTWVFIFTRREYILKFYKIYSTSPFYLERKYLKIKFIIDKINQIENKQDQTISLPSII